MQFLYSRENLLLTVVHTSGDIFALWVIVYTHNGRSPVLGYIVTDIVTFPV